uniref:procollagen-proline 4-dioxygenase n=1 Tax=Chlamydomonas leiostraca TaxID=1034604 RepID=A0A7S0X1H1_9CHLO|mmetsp:Transcript_8404/g.20967  ORF Transcript_8404/g.20967 Transcript_8404/m.20967 type:complete len:369 (+) Transcript_8404:123-1229(+)
MAPLLALCLVVLIAVSHAGVITLSAEKITKWNQESNDPELLWDPLHTRNVQDLPKAKPLPLPASPSFIEQVAWKPRVFIWHNFISDVEARHLVELAAPQMKRSTVVGAGGKSVEDDYRTSYGTFLRRYQDAVVERLENKVAAWTHLPLDHQEDTQVLRYGIGQFYRVHSDTLRDEQAGVRVATVLIYLNEPEEGGETAFPTSEWISPELVKRYDGGFSDCAKGHVAFKPKRGDALLFWSIDPDGQTEDHHAAHTGCPVIRGAKWTVTKWIHHKPFRPAELDAAIKRQGVPVADVDPGICKDTSTHCAQWAKDDGCNKNRDYMVVSVASPGACRLTCGECTVCAEGDRACYNENRRRIGYLVHDPKEIK